MTEFKALSRMKEIMTEYYIEAKTTKEKPIAWLTSGAPVEFIFAMGIIPIYPENYAAMCAANHQSVELMEAAEAEGSSQDICAYARTDFGAEDPGIGKRPHHVPVVRPTSDRPSQDCRGSFSWLELHIHFGIGNNGS